jgi:hypothetical protein
MMVSNSLICFRVAECGSVCEMEANLNFVDGPSERKTRGFLILRSKLVMEVYCCWVYIRDAPTQSVPHVQMHCMRNIIFYQ